MVDRITVGRIGRPHGLAGELYVLSESDAPDRFEVGATFRTDETSPRDLEVRSRRLHQGKLLLGFVEIAGRVEAEAMRDVGLTIAATDRRPLEKNEFWPDQLIGLTTRDAAGQQFGPVTRVEVDGPQDQLVILLTDGEEALVPFVEELVPEVNLDERFLVINPIEGLFNPSQD